MAYSNVTYTGNGSTTDFTVPFPFLDRSHVAVTVNGVATSFSWLSDGLIRISPAPGNGLSVVISRSSNRHSRLSNYQDAQTLTEAQMDADALQIFYVAQEAFDAVAAGGGGGDMLRALNLSDVLNTTAARNNIGAVAKAGDQMTGPLYLWSSPVSPNEAATKAYVDSRVSAGSTVTSFNTRTGAVTLNGTDVVTALGYTPVNKGGDTMGGFLTLHADPTNPLHAVTKQYVDGITGINTYDWVFQPPSSGIAAVQVQKTQATPTGAYSGLADLKLSRTTGGVAMCAFPVRYYVQAPSSGVDVGYQAILRADNIVNGGLIGYQASVAGPKSNTGTRVLTGIQVSAAERGQDGGLLRNWLGTVSGHIHAYPNNDNIYGDTWAPLYNSSFGFVLTSSPNVSGNIAKTWTGVLLDTDSIAPGGLGFLARGGSSAGNAGLAVMEVWNQWTHGIDFRNATFTDADKTAIWLAQGQAMHFGPLSRIYEDPSGNLTFYDSIAGTKKLSDLLGGGGSILTTDNTFTGKNSFTKAAGAMPAYTVQVKSGTLTPLGTSIILSGSSGYHTAIDVQKHSNATVDTIPSPGTTTGMYLQHTVTGQLPAASAYAGLRVQMESDQTRAGVFTNDVVSGYFGLNNRGVDTGGFGVHVDCYHGGSGSAITTYGSSIEMYRQSTAGFTTAYLARVIDDGASSYNVDVAFCAAPGNLGNKKFSRVFAAGHTALGGTLQCDIGMDLTRASCTSSAIALAASHKITFDASLVYSQRFDAASTEMRFRNENAGGVGVGQDISGLVMSGLYRGKQFFYGGAPYSYGQHYIDVASWSGDAVFSLPSGYRTGTPATPSTPAAYLRVYVDGSPYFLPLYA